MVYVLEVCERCQFLDGRGEELDAFVSNLIPGKPVQRELEQKRTVLVNAGIQFCKLCRAEGKGWGGLRTRGLRGFSVP